MDDRGRAERRPPAALTPSARRLDLRPSRRPAPSPAAANRSPSPVPDADAPVTAPPPTPPLGRRVVLLTGAGPFADQLAALLAERGVRVDALVVYVPSLATEWRRAMSPARRA